MERSCYKKKDLITIISYWEFVKLFLPIEKYDTQIIIIIDILST